VGNVSSGSAHPGCPRQNPKSRKTAVVVVVVVPLSLYQNKKSRHNFEAANLCYSVMWLQEFAARQGLVISTLTEELN